MSGPRVLISGAAGFIGSRLVRRLLEEGAHVHALVRPGGDATRLQDLAGRVTRHAVDIRNAPGLRSIATTIRPDRVFHLAAPPIAWDRLDQMRALLEVAVEGTANLLDALEGVPDAPFIHAGDLFECGPGVEPIRESDPSRPATPYAIARLSGTSLTLGRGASEGRSVVVLRMASTYGPANHPERLMSRLIHSSRTGEAVRLTRPDVSRDWVHVDDVVQALLAASEPDAGAAGRIVNIGSGRATSLGELVSVLTRLAGRAPNARWGEYPETPYDASSWVADSTLAAELLGWRPRITLEDGLRRLLEASP